MNTCKKCNSELAAIDPNGALKSFLFLQQKFDTLATDGELHGAALAVIDTITGNVPISAVLCALGLPPLASAARYAIIQKLATLWVREYSTKDDPTPFLLVAHGVITAWNAEQLRLAALN